MRTDCYEYQSGGLDGLEGLDVTEQVNRFRNLLIAGWPHVDNLMEYHDWENDGESSTDWIQACWEIFVERELLPEGHFLTSFSFSGEGRVSKEGKKATFAVVAKTSKEMKLSRTEKPAPVGELLRLVGFLSPVEGGGFGLYPPFNVAELVKDSKEEKSEIFLARIEDLRFFLKKW
jgi:hypothetical protein